MGPKKAFLGGLFKKKDEKKKEIQKEENIFKKRKQDQKTKQQRLEELKKEMGMSKGGGADMSTMKNKKKKPAPGGGRERHEYLKNIQNPISEYGPKGKLKYTGAKVGMNVTASGESAMGRLQKSGMLKAYTGRAVRQPTETNKEFEMRHEYHTPFGKPEKARGGGIAIKGTNFKGVF